MPMLLDVEDLDVRYGRNHAVRSVSLTLDDGEIVTEEDLVAAQPRKRKVVLGAINKAQKRIRILADVQDINRQKRIQSRSAASLDCLLQREQVFPEDRNLIARRQLVRAAA